MKAMGARCEFREKERSIYGQARLIFVTIGCLPLLLCLQMSAHAQKGPPAPGLATVLSGRFGPLKVRLADLSSRWNAVTVIGNPGSGFPCYTKGQIIRLNGETYLIAYRANGRRLTQNTVLSLSLVNLRNCLILTDFRPFDLKRELALDRTGAHAGDATRETAYAAALLENDPSLPAFQAARIQAANVHSLSNLKQLGMAMQIYLQDNDETFPEMADAAAVREALRPYIKDDSLFKHPATSDAYRWNSGLSRKKLIHVDSASTTILACEAKDASDETRGVVFADGHTRRLKKAEWAELSKKAGLP